MKYEIQSRNDFMTGSYLVIQIPEHELDMHALYTIQADCPDFILPFHYKSTNGQVELTYKIGAQSKLKYFSGDFSPKEYTQLWQSLLKPLLNCGDWFMNPCSFVLSADHLYYDKNKKTINYIYIPSIGGCTNYDAFHEMVIEVSKMMTVSDAVIENKILRSIIENFNPVEFLQMLNDHLSEYDEPQMKVSDVRPEYKRQHEPEKIVDIVGSDFTPEINEPKIPSQEFGDEIVIDFKSNAKNEQNKKDKDSNGFKFFSGKNKKKYASEQNLPESISSQPCIPQLSIPQPIVAVENHSGIIDATQCISNQLSGSGLRYVGRGDLPEFIKTQIGEGEIFTIGRFDAAIGKKQSSFEFDKKTKAISRRHAVIERNGDEYKIVDLSSSAGTFVNDNKLPPNTPYELMTGYRVSFGNSGADYVWENN